jgi:hypothetical protein
MSDVMAQFVIHALSAPATSGIGRQHYPHGSCLARAVGAHEPEHLVLGDGERQVIEGDQIAVAAGQALKFQHVVPLRPVSPSL